MFAAGSAEAAAGWHATCQSRECACLHHRDARRSITELLQIQTRRKMVASGIDLEAPYGVRLECLHGHDLTLPDALNSHGECRECRRISTHNYKQRVKAKLEAERILADARRRAGLPPMCGLVVPALPRLWIVQTAVRGQVVTQLPRVQRGRRLAG